MNRVTSVDITKGLLIITVVMCHIGLPVSRVFYYFSMPAFLFISGFFLPSAPKLTNKLFRSKLTSLLVPYFCYIALFSIPYFIYSDDSWYKGLFKLIMGGRLITRMFAPYWFITAYTGGFILYYLIETYVPKKFKVWTLGLIYMLAHIEARFFSPDLTLLFYFPFALDISLIVVVMLYIGHEMKSIYFKVEESKMMLASIFIFTAILCFFFIWFSEKGYFSYEFDMKYIKYGGWFADIIVGMIFLLFLLTFSRLLQVPLKWIVMDRIGKASLTIMYLHMPIVMMLGFIHNKNLLTVIGVVVPLVFHELFQLNAKTRFLFLGRKTSPQK